MSGILFPISFLLGFIIINNVENFQGPVATNLSLRPYGLLFFTSLDIYSNTSGSLAVPHTCTAQLRANKAGVEQLYAHDQLGEAEALQKKKYPALQALSLLLLSSHCVQVSPEPPGKTWDS